MQVKGNRCGNLGGGIHGVEEMCEWLLVFMQVLCAHCSACTTSIQPKLSRPRATTAVQEGEGEGGGGGGRRRLHRIESLNGY